MHGRDRCARVRSWSCMCGIGAGARAHASRDCDPVGGGRTRQEPARREPCCCFLVLMMMKVALIVVWRGRLGMFLCLPDAWMCSCLGPMSPQARRAVPCAGSGSPCCGAMRSLCTMTCTELCALSDLAAFSYGHSAHHCGSALSNTHDDLLRQGGYWSRE